MHFTRIISHFFAHLPPPSGLLLPKRLPVPGLPGGGWLPGGGPPYPGGLFCGGIPPGGGPPGPGGIPPLYIFGGMPPLCMFGGIPPLCMFGGIPPRYILGGGPPPPPLGGPPPPRLSSWACTLNAASSSSSPTVLAEIL